jgi:hypothetical protein
MTGYRVPSRVAQVLVGEDPAIPEVVYLMLLPDGEPAVLRDSAAVIWSVAATGEDDVSAAVAARVDVPLVRVAPDVERFLDELVSLGLIEVGGSGDRR